MMTSEHKLFERAADLVENYTHAHTVQFDVSTEEIQRLQKEFCDKFSPEQLKSLEDEKLLSYMFLTADGNNDSLCYHLEFNAQLKKTFGSISGGSSFKFGLFQRQEDGKWMTGAPTKQEELTNEAALDLGRQIRDYLVKGCDIIRAAKLDTRKDYEDLDDALNALMGKFASYAWIQKYFHMIFPDIFVGWYVTDWQRHVLYGFSVEPSTKYYAMNGQLALIKNKTSYMSPHFQSICYSMFGEIRHFYRLGSSDSTNHYAEEWQTTGMVAIGWGKIGDLLNYLKNGSLDREKITQALAQEYYTTDAKTASRKAGEIKTFYETNASTVLVVMDGTSIQGFVDELSPYYYDDSADMAHCKSGTWKIPFSNGDRLPEDEGIMTTCYEIHKTANLMYLYSKYYGYYRDEAEDVPKVIGAEIVKPIKFNTGINIPYLRNRIYFGAPGTGKSYTLNREKDNLLSDGGEYERVTFHPDYSYANFVGTYKPVPCKDSDGKDAITYSYVPGPFMRTYVKALQNSRADAPKPFLLVIEEINRANVAAVFGDVFQLLDRGDDEVSEYPIQASEDIKKFLSLPENLGGDPDDYSEIRIPDNMFIWATMNSADQGVFPMDTAFKRRWDFTYLGIDDSEAGIVGKKVVLGQGEYRRVVEWNALRKAINNELLTYKVNEDKLMGPYFISKKNLPEGEMLDPVAFTHIFKNKVIMYLFDDAAKQKRPSLFAGCKDENKNLYSQICREFDTKGVFIFCTKISDCFLPEDDGE